MANHTSQEDWPALESGGQRARARPVLGGLDPVERRVIKPYCLNTIQALYMELLVDDTGSDLISGST